MSLVPIGRMASLNGVSEKKLRWLQERGLLEPAEVRPDTGYRYYSIEQSATIDMIEQLRALGFSYDDILLLEKEGSMAFARDMLKSRVKDLEDQQGKIAVRLKEARSMLDNCELFLDGPPIGRIFLEYAPEQTILCFSEDAWAGEGPVRPLDISLESWELVTRRVKMALKDSDRSTLLFQNPGIVITKENLVNGTYSYGDIFVPIDGSDGEDLLASGVTLKTVPAGPRLYVLSPLDALSENEEGENTEFSIAKRLMNYALENGLEVNGDYYGQQLLSIFSSLAVSGGALLYSSLPVKARQ